MRIKFITFGCKVNQYETQALTEQFLSRGCQIVGDKESADIYVINTCSVTAKADAKCKEAVNRIKHLNPQAKIAVAGCLAKLNAFDILKWGVDYIIPPEKKASLVGIVLENIVSDAGIWSLNINGFINQRAFVKIQDGCDNYCSFCKIPYLRGRSVSRPYNDVIEEVKRISLCREEIVLCGINLGLYGKDLKPSVLFSTLIEELLEIDMLTRLRLSSLEPDLIDSKLLSLLRRPKLCPHLHLPFQSGDNNILRAMNKKETVELYHRVADQARAIRPDTAVSCDIMVGFPGEGRQEFENTVKFIRAIKPMRLHVFVFSPREKTLLAKTQIKNSKEAVKRAQILKAIGEELFAEYVKQCFGKCFHMIAEEHRNRETIGHTENYLSVIVKDIVPIGSSVPVFIEKINGQRVMAKFCGNTGTSFGSQLLIADD